MIRYETSFHVKTTTKTKQLMEQLLFQTMTEHGHHMMHAAAFEAVVAELAQIKGITVDRRNA